MKQGKILMGELVGLHCSLVILKQFLSISHHGVMDYMCYVLGKGTTCVILSKKDYPDCENYYFEKIMFTVRESHTFIHTITF